MNQPVISSGDPRDSAATELLRQSHELMDRLFPSEANHYLSVDALCGPGIDFFVARVEGQTIGCAALAHRGDYGEVKSMFVAESARGTGAGQALLAHIEQVARDADLPCLRLETGDTLHAAHRLYERAGFEYTGPFGNYRPDPISLFMEKKL